MFCPKCGNQLPEGAQFCSSCGSQMNAQPVAPVMPAEPTIPTEPVISVTPTFTPEQPAVTEAPVAPLFTPEQPVVTEVPVAPAFTPEQPVVTEAPVAPLFTPEQPVVTEAPVAPAFTPEQPVVTEVPVAPAFTPEQPAMSNTPVAPLFTPEQPVVNNMAIPATPGLNVATAPAKKSKAPLFIGLGIGALLIAIIAIIIVLLVTGDDDDDNKKPASATENQTTTAIQETTTETPTVSKDDIDFDDAKDVAEDMFDALYFMEYEECVDYLYPGLAEFIEYNTGKDAAEYWDDYSWDLYTPDGDFLDYEIQNAVEDDDDYFKQLDMDNVLSQYDEYVKPSAFAKVEVKFTYETQTASIYIMLGYADDQFYIYDFDVSDFDITFEKESTTENETTTGTTGSVEETIQQMLDDNFVPLSGGDYEGSILSDPSGFQIKMPSDWTSSVYEANNLTYYLSPDNQTQFNVVYDPTFGIVDPVTFLASMYDIYVQKGISEVEFGTLSSPNADGYVSAYTYLDGSGSTIYGYQYIFTKEGNTNCYVVTVETYDFSTEYFTIANYVAASLTID